jgi:hypothetical protein
LDNNIKNEEYEKYRRGKKREMIEWNKINAGDKIKSLEIEEHKIKQLKEC